MTVHVRHQHPDFANTIRRGVPFVASLAELGVEEWGKGRYATSYQLLSPSPSTPENV